MTNDVRDSLSFLVNTFTPAELASLYPNEVVGLRRAQNAGCCLKGTKNFALVEGLDAPPTLEELVDLLENNPRDHMVRHRRHYIATVIAYTVVLRVSRHKFVRRQFAAYCAGRISWDDYRETMYQYAAVLIAARKVGHMGI